MSILGAADSRWWSCEINAEEREQRSCQKIIKSISSPFKYPGKQTHLTVTEKCPFHTAMPCSVKSLTYKNDLGLTSALRSTVVNPVYLQWLIFGGLKISNVFAVWDQCRIQTQWRSIRLGHWFDINLSFWYFFSVICLVFFKFYTLTMFKLLLNVVFFRLLCTLACGLSYWYAIWLPSLTIYLWVLDSQFRNTWETVWLWHCIYFCLHLYFFFF